MRVVESCIIIGDPFHWDAMYFVLIFFTFINDVFCFVLLFFTFINDVFCVVKSKLLNFTEVHMLVSKPQILVNHSCNRIPEIRPGEGLRVEEGGRPRWKNPRIQGSPPMGASPPAPALLSITLPPAPYKHFQYKYK